MKDNIKYAKKKVIRIEENAIHIFYQRLKYLRSDFSKRHISIFDLEAKFDGIGSIMLNYIPSDTKHF